MKKYDTQGKEDMANVFLVLSVMLALAGFAIAMSL